MKFELKEEYIQKGKTGKPSLVILPSGICEVLINTAGAPVKKNYKCNFTTEKTNCVLIQVGFMGIIVCGDILITLKEMGYDLASKDDWKRAKKQDREKIVAEYEKLASEQPELFDASKVDTSQLSQVIEKSGAEAATASDEKDTNTDASPEKRQVTLPDITVKDLKFPLLESYFTYKTTMKMNVVSQIILPSGKYETESIFNGNTYFDSSGLDCDITGISASKNNNLFKFSASTFGVIINVCGDILITLIEMDKYDFRNKKELKKIKGDKDYILENYFRLLEEKPELFDEKRIKDTQLNSKKTVTKTKPSKKVNKQKTKRKSPSTRGATKKLDEKLKTDESTESVEETSSDELKELEELKDMGILTEEEFQKKKEEILSQDSTISQIEEETTPDKIVCDFCNGDEWNEEDEGSDELHQVFDEDDFEFEEPLALWCKACVDFMNELTEKIDFDWFGEDLENKGFVLSSEDYEHIISEGKKKLILDALRNRKSR